MAESFLCLMADLDESVQKNMSEWYAEIKKEGFTGTQTPNLPYHISLATYPLEMEQEVLENVKKVAAEFFQVEVDLSHIGMFAGGQVLFAAPDRNPELDKLQEACQMGVPQQYGFTPHTTILIDDPEVVHAALPTFVKCFRPMTGRITRLHLCAFWPTREIAALELLKEEK